MQNRFGLKDGIMLFLVSLVFLFVMVPNEVALNFHHLHVENQSETEQALD